MIDKGNLTMSDNARLHGHDGLSEFSFWLGFELNGVEDNEDRRSALSDLETAETDSAGVETTECKFFS